jgi:ActR/RegA family two-component response regulator
MTAAQELASGLSQLRMAAYYRQTLKRWGPAFPTSLLGQAEAKFMAKTPTRAIVDDGLQLLRNSWAYQKTRSSNPRMFEQTAMGKAEAAFLRARTSLPATVVGLGLFAGNGLFCINPRGGVEDSDVFKAAGFSWAAANVGDHGT